jgi:hypothetical protein
MQVSSRGLRAFRSRPASRRQRSDLITLAHIKEQSRLSLGSYGRPRITEELKEIGLDVGHRRVGRLMRQNGISVVRTRKHKVTTDSDHKFNIAPNLLDRDFMADAPNQKWAGTSRDIRFANALSVSGHQLCLDTRGLAVSGCDIGPAFPKGHRLGRQQSHETGPGNQGAEHGHRIQDTAQGLHSPHGSWVAILFTRLPEDPAPTWVQGVDVWERQLL